MTDHGQAAIEAGADALWSGFSRTYGMGTTTSEDYEREAEITIAAAEPHLRKKWAEELVRRIESSNLGAPLHINSDGTARIANGPEMRAMLCAFILEGTGE